MPEHTILARHKDVKSMERLSIPLIKRCIEVTLDLEGVDKPCEVSVLITNDSAMRQINLKFRGIDKTTDVLSFPMVEFSPPGWGDPGPDAADPDTGIIPLGDIVLSAKRVELQALDHGRNSDTEAAHLTIHSVLHLLGYDHMDGEDDDRVMRQKENLIMKMLKKGEV